MRNDDRPYLLVNTRDYSLCGWYTSIEEAQRNMGWPYRSTEIGTYAILFTTEAARGTASINWNNV